MPEGHTIRRIVEDQAPLLVGDVLSFWSPIRRFESGAAQIDGRRLERMDAWGKHLFYFFPGRRVLHVHLGMDGWFRLQRQGPDGARPPRRDVWLRGAGPRAVFDLATPKICEVIDDLRQQRIVSRLGPDPLRGDAPAGVYERLSGHEGTLGEALLDQSLIAGIGNVYRSEILFHCGIHPEREPSSVTPAEWECIWATTSRMLAEGVANRGDIATVNRRRDLWVRDSRDKFVYGQRFCARCGTPIRRWDLAGRVAYACETCQPPPLSRSSG